MWLEDDPKTLYPNTVAAAMMDLVRDNPEGFAVDFFEQDVIVDGNQILASERVQERPIALFHVESLDAQNVNPEFQKDRIRVRVRLANHNPRHMEQQQQEAIVLAQRVRSRLQGREITPANCSPGVVDVTTAVQEDLNEPQLAVYFFFAEVIVTHNTT